MSATSGGRLERVLPVDLVLHDQECRQLETTKGHSFFMPTYEYACKSCGEHLEVVQSFRDNALTECPACGGQLRKVFGNIGITFKGSGFYKTDSRSGSAKAAGAKPGTGEGAAGAESPGAKSGDGSGTKSGDGSGTKSGDGSGATPSGQAPKGTGTASPSSATQKSATPAAGAA